MTREEIEKFWVVEPYCLKTDEEERWYKIGCIDGLNAADAEPNLESLWHDVSEEPLLEEVIISIDEHDFAYISERFSCTFLYNFEDYYWKEYVNLLKIKKWAYISDLSPKGFNK